MRLQLTSNLKHPASALWNFFFMSAAMIMSWYKETTYIFLTVIISLQLLKFSCTTYTPNILFSGSYSDGSSYDRLVITENICLILKNDIQLDPYTWQNKVWHLTQVTPIKWRCSIWVLFHTSILIYFHTVMNTAPFECIICNVI